MAGMVLRSRRRRQSGQAVIEYAFLMVLLATIGVAVIALAGNQLKSTFNDVIFEFNHLTDTTITGSPTCPDGTPAVLRGHQYKC
jgi:Flp pilus assembly pilin Flp